MSLRPLMKEMARESICVMCNKHLEPIEPVLKHIAICMNKHCELFGKHIDFLDY